MELVKLVEGEELLAQNKTGLLLEAQLITAKVAELVDKLVLGEGEVEVAQNKAGF